MKRWLIVLLGSLMWPLSCLAEPATMTRADNLYEKPFVDARVVVKLTAGLSIEVQKRQGAWYQIKTGGKTGWVKMLSVRRTAAATVASSGSLSQLATGRAGTGQIVTTTGVRGLGEEQLRTAPFSEAAVAAVEHFRADPMEAERSARQAGLAPRAVPPLPAPGGGL